MCCDDHHLFYFNSQLTVLSTHILCEVCYNMAQFGCTLGNKLLFALSCCLLQIELWWSFWGQKVFPWGRDLRGEKRGKAEEGLGRRICKTEVRLDSRNHWEVRSRHIQVSELVDKSLYLETQKRHHKCCSPATKLLGWKPGGTAAVVWGKVWEDFKCWKVRQN